MRNCKASNLEELNNIVNNGGEIYDISVNQTQQDTIGFLKHSNESFTKKDGKYETKDSGAKLATTVTTKIAEKNERKFGKSKSVNLQTSAKAGTFVHALNEGVLNHLIAITDGLSTEETIDHVNSLTWNNHGDTIKGVLLPIAKDNIDIRILGSVNEEDRHNLQAIFEGAKDIFLQMHNRQKYINRRLNTNGKAYLSMEQIVVDPKSSMGGTGDLLAIFSDNTAAVFDFKTKIPAKKYLDRDGNLVSRDYITYTAKENYKMQLASLQRILTKRYGIKQVIQSRIVPIQLNMPINKETGEIGNTITKIVYGAKQNEFLAQYAPLPELTGFKDLDDFLIDIEKRIKNYENKLKVDSANRDFYKTKLDELQQAKQSILVKHSFNDLVKFGEDLLKSTEGEKMSEMTIDQLRDIKDELKSLTLLSNATYEYRQALASNAKNKDIITQIEITVKSLSSAVQDRLFEVEQELYNKRLTDAVKELSGYSILDQSGRFITFNDEGFFGKYTNQLSQFDNPIFKSYRSLLDKAQYDTRDKVSKLIENVISIDNNLRNWMKENSKDEAWLIKSLIDTESDSSSADNLHSTISPEFRAKIKEVKESKDMKKILEYYEANATFADWFAKENIEKKAYFENKYSDPKAAANAYARWLENNDLTLVNGKPKQPEAWLAQLGRGKLKLRQSVIEKNYSKEYQYIKSIPVLSAYYNMFEDYNKEFRKILGVDYYNLPNNFLPNIRKSNIDRLLDNGIIKGGADIFNNFMEELNIREDDMLFGEIDPDTGALKKTIPKFFISPFKHKNGKVAIGEKSYDLTKSLILFSKMAYNYEQMNKIEGVVLTMRDFLSEKGEQVIKRGGKVLHDLVGNELSSKIAGKDIESIFQSFVDLYLYGVSVNPISDNSSGKYEKLILQAKQYFTLKSLGLGFIPAFGGFLAAKTQAAIEGFKGQVYTTEQYKKAMTFVYNDRQKFHALSAFFDPMGVKYDFFAIDGDTVIGDPRERNKIKKYVNSRMLLRSFSAGDEFIDESILAAMAQNFYIDEDGKLRRMKDDKERTEKASRSVWNLFNYNGEEATLNVSEEHLKDIKIDFRKAAQSAQSKIKGTIPEEDKAYWQTQIVGQVIMHFKSWMPGVMRERLGKTKYNDALQLIEMGRFTAFGQELYNAEQLSIPMFMKEILLPKLGELAKHLVWYNGGKSNPRVKLSYENWLNNNPHYRGVVSFSDFLAAQKAQMKALIIELRILLTFAMLIALLGSDWDDDGKKFYQEMWLTRKLVAVMAKTNSEISFTYNPAEFANMIKNPIPLAGLLTDAVKVISNTYDETVDVTLGETFPLPFHKPQKQDKTGAFYYTSKLIPGAGQLEKFLEIFGNNNNGSINQ
jgi:hypothetical protein